MSTSRLLLFVAGLLCGLVSACATSRVHPPHDKKDLEQIRSAAIVYFNRQADTHFGNFRTLFIDELKRAVVFQQDDVDRIGVWLIEQREDRWCLIREPSHVDVPVAVAFGLVLKYTNRQWTVIDDFREEQWFEVKSSQ